MTVQTSTIAWAVQDRRSIRAFRDEPLPTGTVEEILRIALWSPSPHNSQPWRFTVLTQPEDRWRLANAMADRLKDTLLRDGMTAEEIERVTTRSRTRIGGAPVVLLCSVVRDGLAHYADRTRNDLEFQMAVQSVGAVLQSVFLLAHERGIGTCWMAAPMYCADLVRDALSLPAWWEPQALVLMGYPSHPGRIRERRELSEVVDIR
jgi:coenzyme F420-0:L-glutamate ligase/coenzyme F420-1:gamma-L-glutamate ligase